MELTAVYRLFHPTTIEYKFFTSAHGPFSTLDHLLGNKASPNKLKKKGGNHITFDLPQWNEAGC